MQIGLRTRLGMDYFMWGRAHCQRVREFMRAEGACRVVVGAKMCG